MNEKKNAAPSSTWTRAMGNFEEDATKNRNYLCRNFGREGLDPDRILNFV
jgi:hypothetical protein